MTDMTVHLAGVPASGETVVGESFATGHGGKGANQAAMAALLGAQVEMVACVGDDVFGAEAVQNFRSLGVQTTGVRVVDNTANGAASIWVDRVGENRIVIVPGANAHMTPADVSAELSRVGHVDAVVCQLEIPMECVAVALEAGRRLGALTILNPAPMAPVPIEILELADWITPNESEFALLRDQVLGRRGDDVASDAVALTSRLGAGVVVTQGDRGALVCPPDAGVTSIPTKRVRVLDTSGAGDAFSGAFAYALTSRYASPVTAAAFACACASASVQRPGTQASYPHGAELDELKAMLTQTALGALADAPRGFLQPSGSGSDGSHWNRYHEASTEAPRGQTQ